MPTKVVDLYNQIIRDELPSPTPHSLDELHNYIHLSRGIFQKEIAGRYFLRNQDRTLIVDSADLYGLSAKSFYPAGGDLLSVSFGTGCFGDYFLLEEQELTPEELRDLRESGLRHLTQTTNLTNRKDPLEGIGCPDSQRLPKRTKEKQKNKPEYPPSSPPPEGSNLWDH